MKEKKEREFQREKARKVRERVEITETKYTRQSPITETKRGFPDQAIFCCQCSHVCILHIRTSVCVSKEKEQQTESNHRDQEEGSPQPKQFSVMTSQFDTLLRQERERGKKSETSRHQRERETKIPRQRTTERIV